MTTLDWIQGSQIGTGIFGPIYLGLQKSGIDDIGELITGERLDHKDTRINELVLKILENHKVNPPTPNSVQYLGYQQQQNEVFIFHQYVPGTTISDCIKTNSKWHESTTRDQIRDILLGLEQIQSHTECGHPIVFTTATIFLRQKTDLQTTMVQPLPLDLYKFQQKVAHQNYELKDHQSLLPIFRLPELESASVLTEKATTWFLGLAALEMLTGNLFDGIDDISTLISPDVLGYLGHEAIDFIHACLHKNPDARPSTTDVLSHPFMLAV